MIITPKTPANAQRAPSPSFSSEESSHRGPTLSRFTEAGHAQHARLRTAGPLPIDSGRHTLAQRMKSMLPVQAVCEGSRIVPVFEAILLEGRFMSAKRRGSTKVIRQIFAGTLEKSQLPDVVNDAQGRPITRPPKWS